MKELLSRQIIAGAVVLLIGCLAFWEAQNYSFGTIGRIGPGFFPQLVSVTLVGAGALILVPALFAHRERPPRISWSPLLFVSVGLIVFATSMQWLGYIPAIFLTSVCVSLGDRLDRPAVMLATTSGLCMASWLIFSVMLGMPMQPFRMP
jgi:hypothetical protein